MHTMARKPNCLTLQNSLTEEDRGEGADLRNTGNMRSVRLKSRSACVQDPLVVSHRDMVCLLCRFSPVLTLCDPMDCGPPGSSVHGILQARILESGLPCLPPGTLPNSGIKSVSLMSPALLGGFFTTSAT
ncbi:unnamed protein product [Rangifer tarandus platyrhynchus]|uniref:Uncharacterized protein n=2 Tax=Rangifer tarandus platyrhynchus TaxID=3082113 RepID=A0AC59ZL10_RANTA|nr:unnamed protein product [Rangifer tarandus platyrhynchus]